MWSHPEIGSKIHSEAYETIITQFFYLFKLHIHGLILRLYIISKRTRLENIDMKMNIFTIFIFKAIMRNNVYYFPQRVALNVTISYLFFRTCYRYRYMYFIFTPSVKIYTMYRSKVATLYSLSCIRVYVCVYVCILSCKLVNKFHYR